LRERVGVRGMKKRISILIEEEVIRHAQAAFDVEIN